MITLSASLSHLPALSLVGAVAMCTSTTISRSACSVSLDARLAFWTVTGEAASTTVNNNNNNEKMQQQQQQQQQQIPFFDPHFHIWDMVDGPHDPVTLGSFITTFPRFTFADVEKYVGDEDGNDAAGGGHGQQHRRRLTFIGGMHVEAIPKDLDGLKEVRWVAEQLKAHDEKTNIDNKKKRYLMNGYANFCEPDEEKLATLLQQFAALGVRSVRQIVNFEPSWPHVDRDMLLCDGIGWKLHLLPQSGIAAFDLQCNPHQLASAARVVARPEFAHTTRFVLNHLGCVTAAQWNDHQGGREAYLHDMQLLAANRNVFVKLSMMEYAHDAKTSNEVIASHWTQSSSVRCLVAEVIRIFGCRRCMLASNFPVSIFPLLPSGTGETLPAAAFLATAGAWRRWVETLCQAVGDDEMIEWLANRSAARAYKLDS